MTDRNFKGFFFGGRKEAGFFSRKRNDEGEEIERSAFFWGSPTEVKAEISEIGLGRIAKDLLFWEAVAGVAAELVVPDAGAMALLIGGREDGDGGTKRAVVGGVFQVAKAAVVDFFLGLSVTGIEQVKFGPEKSADATNAVAPSEAATVVELGQGEGVSAGFSNGLGDVGSAGTRDGRCFFFGAEEAEESVGGLGERKGFFAASETQLFGESKEGARGHGEENTPRGGGVKSLSSAKSVLSSSG